MSAHAGTTVLLVRHGMTDAVRDRRIAGRASGVRLDATGRRQAEQLARQLSARPIVAIYSSPLPRARDTARPLARTVGLPVTATAAFNELDYGEWTGRAIDDLEGDPRWRRYNADRAHARAPGGESLRELASRVADGLSAIATRHRGGLVAVVTHAEVIRCAVANVNGWSLDEALRRVDPAPAEWVEVTLGAAGATAIRPCAAPLH